MGDYSCLVICEFEFFTGMPKPNFDLVNIHTPVNPIVLRNLLQESNYDREKMNYLVRGFREGFDLEYTGPWKRKDQSQNIPINDNVGSLQDLWEKMVKEVEKKRFVGPFEDPPSEFYI